MILIDGIVVAQQAIVEMQVKKVVGVFYKFS